MVTFLLHLTCAEHPFPLSPPSLPPSLPICPFLLHTHPSPRLPLWPLPASLPSLSSLLPPSLFSLPLSPLTLFCSTLTPPLVFPCGRCRNFSSSLFCTCCCCCCCCCCWCGRCSSSSSSSISFCKCLDDGDDAAEDDGEVSKDPNASTPPSLPPSFPPPSLASAEAGALRFLRLLLLLLLLGFAIFLCCCPQSNQQCS